MERNQEWSVARRLLSFLPEVTWPGNNMGATWGSAGISFPARFSNCSWGLGLPFPRSRPWGSVYRTLPPKWIPSAGDCSSLSAPLSPPTTCLGVWFREKEQEGPRRRLHYPPRRGTREALSPWGCFWSSVVGASAYRFVELTFGNTCVIPEICSSRELTPLSRTPGRSYLQGKRGERPGYGLILLFLWEA